MWLLSRSQGFSINIFYLKSYWPSFDPKRPIYEECLEIIILTKFHGDRMQNVTQSKCGQTPDIRLSQYLTFEHCAQVSLEHKTKKIIDVAIHKS